MPGTDLRNNRDAEQPLRIDLGTKENESEGSLMMLTTQIEGYYKGKEVILNKNQTKILEF